MYLCDYLNSEYCNGNFNGCEYLNPTEENQTNKKEQHFCELFNERVYHSGHHPFICRLNKCKDISNYIKNCYIRSNK